MSTLLAVSALLALVHYADDVTAQTPAAVATPVAATEESESAPVPVVTPAAGSDDPVPGSESGPGTGTGTDTGTGTATGDASAAAEDASGDDAISTDDPAGEKQALFEAAMADYQANRCEEAMAPLKTLVASGFQGSDAAMALRACYHELHGIDGSVAKLRKEIAANPDDAVAHSNLGVFLMFQGQWDEAQKEVLTALKLNPNDLDAKLNLAWWYAQVGQSHAAIREHQAILAIDPGNKRSLIELCTLIAERENDPKKALPYCEEHAKGQETNEIAGVTLGLVRMRAGDLDGAEAAFQRVADANPGARTAVLSLGHLRQYRGDFDGAQKAFEAVLAAAPEDEEARLALAHLLSAKREYGKAILQYKKVYEQTHSGMALGGLAKAYLSKYFFAVIGALLAAMGLLLWRYLNVRVPEPPRPANAH